MEKVSLFKIYLVVQVVFVCLVSPVGAEDPITKHEENWFKRQVRIFSAYPHLDRANRLIDADRLPEAREELKKYLEKGPDDLHAKLQYLDVLSRLKDYATVVTEADIVLKTNPDLITALTYRGLAHQHLGQLTPAVADFHAVAVNPKANEQDRLFALNMVADLSIQNQQYTEALAALQDISRISHDFNLRFRQGMVHEKLGRATDAETAYRGALDMAKSEDERLKVLLSLGELYKRNKNWEKAQAAFESALKIKPQNPELMQTIAEMAYARKNYSQAILWLRQALAIRPNTEGRELLGNALYLSGLFAEAVPEFAQVLSEVNTDEDRYRLLMARGFAYFDQKEHRKAAEDFEKALTINNNLDAMMAYAQALEGAGDIKEAIAILNKVFETAPSGDLHLRLGALYAKIDDYENALKHLEEAAKGELTPEQKVSIYKQQGVVYYKQGNFTEARSIMEQALILNAEDPEIYSSLGEICVRLDAYADAERYFQKSLDFKETPQILAQLAQAQIKAGQLEEAVQTHQRLLEKEDISKELRGEVLESQGHLYSQLGQPALAVEQFQKAIAEGRDSWQIRQGLAFALYETEQWQAALEQFRLAKVLNEQPVFSLYLSRCYRKLDNRELAGHHLREVEGKVELLTKPQQIEVYRELGYLYAEEGQHDLAQQTWEKLLAMEYDPEVVLYLGNRQRLSGDFATAQQTLESIPEESLSPDSRAVWFDELAQIYIKQNKAFEAWTALSKANQLSPVAERHYRLGLYSQRLGFFDKAVEHFEAAAQLEPANSVYAKDLAYAYLKARRYDDAIRFFEAAVKADPMSLGALAAYKELGYLNMHNLKNDEAIRWFKRAIDTQDLFFYGSTDEEKDKLFADRDRMQSEIRKISNRYDLTVYQVYRPNADDDDSSGSGSVGSGVIRSQGGMEFMYQPRNIGFRDERVFQWVGRVSWNNDPPDTLEIDGDTLQGAAGFRYKPLKAHNFYAGVEKLIDLGGEAVDDWLLRALYSWGDGLELKTGQKAWNYTTFYTDYGYFIEDSIQAYYVEGRQGRTFNIKDKFLVTPHLTLSGRWQDPDPDELSYSEGGGGLLFNHLFNESRYEGKRSSWEWLIQYKSRLDRSSSGAVITSAVHF